jgi:glycosyltransferase involved in cell wall biosynthesis
VLDGAPWFDREKVELLYNGIDPDALRSRADASLARRTLGIDAHTRVVSMVGEIGWRKDQATFLRAIRRWKEVATFRDVVFLIAGEGPERALLEETARSMGLPEDQVRFLGFRRDVPDLLALSDLVVLPSREEGFPNTLLEAMALGRAVIATPVDGIVELIEDGITGRLVEVGDATSLARVMAQLLENESQRTGLGSAAAARVERDFDQENMMDRFEQILRDTVAPNH